MATKEKFHPTKDYNFPKRTFGKTARSFRPEWGESFPWLHYLTENDTVLCHLCMTAELEGKFLVSTRRDPAFVSFGFSNWKVATTAFRKHQASECHKEATEALVALPKQVCDVGELLSVAHREEKAVNRRMLIKIIRTIKFLAPQGLPLRGVGADADSNLVQLLQLQSRDCPELCTWLQKKKPTSIHHMTYKTRSCQQSWQCKSLERCVKRSERMARTLLWQMSVLMWQTQSNLRFVFGQ